MRVNTEGVDLNCPGKEGEDASRARDTDTEHIARQNYRQQIVYRINNDIVQRCIA